ncbi:hypothetical protein J5X84_26600 [Streptosporangiaceae bacterium NEAU-GS5]|nr:hypothetical protein [Streptosporangiaceae bacterium NEAU-GS5]
MTGALARFEGRRLLRNPILWAAAVAAIVLRIRDGRARLPDLTVETVAATTSAAIVAGAALIVVNLVVGRDRRHRMPETLAALPGDAVVRTRAALVPGVLTAALVAAVTLAAELVATVFRGPVAGRFDPWEALGGLALAALAAAAGAALARWTPTLIAAPVAVLVLGFDVLVAGRRPWAVLVIARHDPAWTDRPSAAHLLYLAALAAACGAVALLRHGPRPTRVLALAVAIAVAAPAALAAVSGTPELRATQEQICRRTEAEGVTFCALPRYVAWIPVWAQAVRPVIQAMPPRARAGLPPIRQFDGRWTSYDDQPTTWMVWSKDPAAHQTALAGTVAAVAAHVAGRDTAGQARTVVALWLVGSAVPLGPAPDFGRPVTGAPGVVTIDLGGDSWMDIPGQLGGRGYDANDVACAKRLLRDPGARARIWVQWDTLLDPRTPASALCG